MLVEAKGHFARGDHAGAKSASEYLSKRLCDPIQSEHIARHPGKGTGEWKRLNKTTWFAALPAPEWLPGTNTFSYEDSQFTLADYVPGLAQ